MARMGEIIDGKYEVLREIGRGGMSVVYLAMDKRLNKQWAIKEFRKDKDDVSKQVALKALLDEANLMKKLDHPTLPRIVDIIDNHQTVYVIMDYIEGESLNKILDAYGAQPQEAVIEWAKQLSEVLDYLHTQNPPVIYRDMKPANIMLKPDGTVRLIDFGIAREYKEGKDGDTEAIGTRGYAAPEQFGGKGQTDARTDIYSLGVTLYHLVTGKNPAEPPYEIYPIRHWNTNLSSGLEWLIQKCTQLNPSDRYQSCAEVSYVLDNLDKFDVAYKKKQRSRINLFIASAILTVVFALTSIGLFVGSSSNKDSLYQNYMDTGNYVEASKIFPDRSEPLIKEIDRIISEITAIYVDKNNKEPLSSSEMYESEINEFFSHSKLESIKNSNQNDYVQIQFRLGLAFVTKYKDKDNSKFDGFNTSKKYFGYVLDVANREDKKGLSDNEYNLAELFYSISYFENDLFSLVNNQLANNSKKVIDSLEEYNEKIQINDFDETRSALENSNTFSDSKNYVYKLYWDINVKTSEQLVLLSSTELSDQAKTILVNKLVNNLDKSLLQFDNAGVTEIEMNKHTANIAKTIDNLSKSKDISSDDQEMLSKTQVAFKRILQQISEQYRAKKGGNN